MTFKSESLDVYICDACEKRIERDSRLASLAADAFFAGWRRGPAGPGGLPSRHYCPSCIKKASEVSANLQAELDALKRGRRCTDPPEVEGKWCVLEKIDKKHRWDETYAESKAVLMRAVEAEDFEEHESGVEALYWLEEQIDTLRQGTLPGGDE